MNIAFGMIIFEGDYVLKQCLEQVYPFASQILIAEGPVTYWQKQGRTTSLDDTNKILDNFPDPDNKIKIIHGQFFEKDDQCKAYMRYINDDTDYIWNLDSDEIYKTEDIRKIISFLETENPTSVGVRSCSFYGGFDNYLTGFELNTDNFLRIFKLKKNICQLFSYLLLLIRLLLHFLVGKLGPHDKRELDTTSHHSRFLITTKQEFHGIPLYLMFSF